MVAFVVRCLSALVSFLPEVPSLRLVKAKRKRIVSCWVVGLFCGADSFCVGAKTKEQKIAEMTRGVGGKVISKTRLIRHRDGKNLGLGLGLTTGLGWSDRCVPQGLLWLSRPDFSTARMKTHHHRFVTTSPKSFYTRRHLKDRSPHSPRRCRSQILAHVESRHSVPPRPAVMEVVARTARAPTVPRVLSMGVVYQRASFDRLA